MFALPLAGPALDALDADLPPVADVAVPWLCALVVVALVVSVEERPLSSLGLRGADRRDLPYALVTFVAALLAVVATSPLIAALGPAQTEGSAAVVAHVAVNVAGVLSAAYA